MREVLGATVRSLGALLGVVFVAVRDVLRWLVFWIEGTLSRENEVAAMVCCRC